MNRELVLIIDYGSQYTQLIARRTRELGVYSEILPCDAVLDVLKSKKPKGIILSGSPYSVYDDGAPTIDKGLFELGIPVLGICYGMQLMVQVFGGQVAPSNTRGYGRSGISIERENALFVGVPKYANVWMSHGDSVKNVPDCFDVIAKATDAPIAAISHKDMELYAIQFHPEVTHTEQGGQILKNFLIGVCGCKGDWTTKNFIDEQIARIKDAVGTQRVLCGLSGGVDSSVAAALIQRAIGDRLTCVLVDTGLMRLNEAEEVKRAFTGDFKTDLVCIDAEERFLTALKGVEDPETKRKVIGELFVRTFENESKKRGDFDFLAQGTLYPDVIESASVRGPSATIKSHHNVGGLPKDMKFKLIEPLRELFKDEVRAVGRELGLSDEIVDRHPFPGPGLAVRILGEVTKDKCDTLRQADYIAIEELKKAGLYNEVWQAFCVLLPVKTVGVMGDGRTYENVAAFRAVVSMDGMTADWARLPHDVLAKISNRIINEVKKINRLVYDISSKPPATIEWE
ncbi:glutamine-hydrolyzing GMP synthase [Deferribacterales bacterium RsTz2092]|nr:GMP synthase [glutamine-hydrolyzing] [Deferribacterales bacterium]